MEEKIFNLIEKMYAEMQNMNEKIHAEMQEMKENMATKQDLARLENKMDNNHTALYDGYKQSIEGITNIREQLDKLTDRVENQEIKLQVLKSAK